MSRERELECVIADLKAENARLQSARLDMFAAAALTGLLMANEQTDTPDNNLHEYVAIAAFRVARAMIAEGKE